MDFLFGFYLFIFFFNGNEMCLSDIFILRANQKSKHVIVKKKILLKSYCHKMLVEKNNLKDFQSKEHQI